MKKSKRRWHSRKKAKSNNLNCPTSCTSRHFLPCYTTVYLRQRNDDMHKNLNNSNNSHYLKKRSKNTFATFGFIATDFMITICFIIFAIVLCYLIYNFNIDSQDQKQFDDMAQTISIEDTDDDTKNNNNGIADLINQNSDCIGWIRISGTKIDYPVTQTKDNPQYYLRRDFNKQYSYLGTPFIDSRCDINYDNNLIVYGHNMRDGKMFADLLKYKEKAYCREHNIIHFITPDGVQEYAVVAVCKVKNDDEWYGYTSQTDKEAFNNLISHIKNKSLYFTEESVEYGDCFLTLSTCEYSQTNGRLIVIAKRSDTNVYKEKTD